jgi:hypothetical protein
MKRKHLYIISLFLLSVLYACSENKTEPVNYVNPYIGNISHLLVPTYPTVHLPNSMLRFYPNRDNFTSNNMQGFPLNVVSHRSGKVFTISPFAEETGNIPQNLIYTYDNEIITPYSYFVTLDEPIVEAKFIPAGKCGIFSFSFNEGEDQGFVLKTTNQGELVYENNSISGYDMYDGVRSYLYLEFDRIPGNIKVRERDEISDRTSISGRRVELIAFFNPESTAELKIRYGLSYIGTEQARKNLQADISGWTQ